MIPTFGLILTAPEPLADKSVSQRVHAKAVRTGLEGALLDYWRHGFGDHFKQNVRGKYHHAERSKSYRAIKKRQTRSITDLVRTGKTKVAMLHTRPKFVMAGAINGVARSKAGVGVTGRLELKFPFPTSTDLGRRKDGRPKVGPAQMARELQGWSEEHQVRAARKYEAEYGETTTALLAKSPRVRVRGRGA